MSNQSKLRHKKIINRTPQLNITDPNIGNDVPMPQLEGPEHAIHENGNAEGASAPQPYTDLPPPYQGSNASEADRRRAASYPTLFCPTDLLHAAPTTRQNAYFTPRSRYVPPYASTRYTDNSIWNGSNFQAFRAQAEEAQKHHQPMANKDTHTDGIAAGGGATGDDTEDEEPDFAKDLALAKKLQHEELDTNNGIWCGNDFNSFLTQSEEAQKHRQPIANKNTRTDGIAAGGATGDDTEEVPDTIIGQLSMIDEIEQKNVGKDKVFHLFSYTVETEVGSPDRDTHIEDEERRNNKRISKRHSCILKIFGAEEYEKCIELKNARCIDLTITGVDLCEDKNQICAEIGIAFKNRVDGAKGSAAYKTCYNESATEEDLQKFLPPDVKAAIARIAYNAKNSNTHLAEKALDVTVVRKIMREADLEDHKKKCHADGVYKPQKFKETTILMV